MNKNLVQNGFIAAALMNIGGVLLNQILHGSQRHLLWRSLSM